MSENKFQEVYDYIEESTGIRTNPSHKIYLDGWIDSNLKQFKYTVPQYLDLLRRDEMERSALIDEAAINETYFFREELHFSYLEDMIFPSRAGTTMNIWSAASSSGEEALSLYALGKKCGVDIHVTASDIDQNALNILRQGEYGNHSFRRNENHYMALLNELGTFTDGEEKKLIVSDECKSHVTAVTYNLIADTDLPVQEESVDIIFLRNVFIYFSSQNQLKVLQKVSRALKPGGLLFLSINEIAGVECPDSLPLIKDHFQSVYFFRKVTPAEKKTLAEKRRRRSDMAPLAAQLEELPALKTPASPRTPVPPAPALTARPAAAPADSADTTVFTGAPVTTIEELWAAVQQLMENRRFSEARQSVSAFHFRAAELEFKNYFVGMIALEENQLDTAYEAFFRSAVANPQFWPAQFQLGMTCQRMQNSKGAEDALSRCIKLLKQPELTDNTKYAFLLENFSPAYFLNLCNSLLRN